jgi:hypothetical protein
MPSKKERDMLKSPSLATNMRCRQCGEILIHEIYVPDVLAQACSPKKKDREAAKVVDAICKSVAKIQRIKCKCIAVQLEVAPEDEIDDPYLFAKMIDEDGIRPKFWPPLTDKSDGLDN